MVTTPDNLVPYLNSKKDSTTFMYLIYFTKIKDKFNLN